MTKKKDPEELCAWRLQKRGINFSSNPRYAGIKFDLKLRGRIRRGIVTGLSKLPNVTCRQFDEQHKASYKSRELLEHFEWLVSKADFYLVNNSQLFDDENGTQLRKDIQEFKLWNRAVLTGKIKGEK